MERPRERWTLARIGRIGACESDRACAATRTSAERKPQRTAIAPARERSRHIAFATASRAPRRAARLRIGTMPYHEVSELPPAQVDQYDRHQKEAFLKAFNRAYDEYGGDEHRAFAVAHHAAKQAAKRGSQVS
jgi:cation transport regulator